MATTTKTVWRMGVRDKKDWHRWSWSKQYDTFEELMGHAAPFLKSNPGAITRIITQVINTAIAGA
jgi:hypothetical protein